MTPIFHNPFQESTTPQSNSEIESSQPTKSCWAKVKIFVQKVFYKRHLGLSLFILWAILCIPGNVVTMVLYINPKPGETITLTDSDETDLKEESNYDCHENKADWNTTLDISKHAFQGKEV